MSRASGPSYFHHRPAVKSKLALGFAQLPPATQMCILLSCCRNPAAAAAANPAAGSSPCSAHGQLWRCTHTPLFLRSLHMPLPTATIELASPHAQPCDPLFLVATHSFTALGATIYLLVGAPMYHSITAQLLQQLLLFMYGWKQQCVAHSKSEMRVKRCANAGFRRLPESAAEPAAGGCQPAAPAQPAAAGSCRPISWQYAPAQSPLATAAYACCSSSLQVCNISAEMHMNSVLGPSQVYCPFIACRLQHVPAGSFVCLLSARHVCLDTIVQPTKQHLSPCCITCGESQRLERVQACGIAGEGSGQLPHSLGVASQLSSRPGEPSPPPRLQLPEAAALREDSPLLNSRLLLNGACHNPCYLLANPASRQQKLPAADACVCAHQQLSWPAYSRLESACVRKEVTSSQVLPGAIAYLVL